MTFGGVISGTGSLAQLGAGTTILTGANTNTGGTTISAGTLQIGAGGATGSIVGNVGDNGTLAFDRSDTMTFGGVVSGTGSLAQSGAGTTILAGANTYSGGTTISAGTLQIGNGGTTGSILGNVLDNSALAFDRSDNLTFGGVISGAGSLT
jgi:autotransporter-associated beta strand protein